MYESTFERYVVNKVKSVGGRAFKWVCPGVSGAPDRICIFPGGKIVFIELKRPGIADGRSERQKKLCRLLRALNCDVRRISEKEELEKLLKEVSNGI